MEAANTDLKKSARVRKRIARQRPTCEAYVGVARDLLAHIAQLCRFSPSLDKSNENISRGRGHLAPRYLQCDKFLSNSCVSDIPVEREL